MISPEKLSASRVQNMGGSCTTAAVLTVLGGLGARALPALPEATLALGAAGMLMAPGLLDYVSLPGRRAPLDERIEALSARHGLRVSSRTALVIPGLPQRPRAGEVLVTNLAWGQEAPGHYGTWGWHPLRPVTYTTGGHSVVLAGIEASGAWLVVDPNLPGVQRWPRPGVAVTVTRIRAAAGEAPG